MTEQVRGQVTPRAIRLIFAYEGNSVRLIDRQRLELPTPPTDAISDHEGQQGFWVELRRPDERVTYRRVLANPVGTDAEVFSPDPARSLSRVPIERPSGVFTVLVPDVEEADHVVLMSSVPPAVERIAPGAPAPLAVEMARFALRADGGS
jgi:hypothetical protein